MAQSDTCYIGLTRPQALTAAHRILMGRSAERSLALLQPAYEDRMDEIEALRLSLTAKEEETQAKDRIIAALQHSQESLVKERKKQKVRGTMNALLYGALGFCLGAALAR